MYFTPAQIALVNRTFEQAEKMTSKYYRLSDAVWQRLRYEVKTRAYLTEEEKKEHVFAHLCRYVYKKAGWGDGYLGLYFYRICLQDDCILDAVERAGSFIKLPPLLLYIAVHELVHMIRFDTGYGNFDMEEEEKRREEKKVHEITSQVLSPIVSAEMKIVLECFNEKTKIFEMIN